MVNKKSFEKIKKSIRKSLVEKFSNNNKFRIEKTVIPDGRYEFSGFPPDDINGDIFLVNTESYDEKKIKFYVDIGDKESEDYGEYNLLFKITHSEEGEMNFYFSKLPNLDGVYEVIMEEDSDMTLSYLVTYKISNSNEYLIRIYQVNRDVWDNGNNINIPCDKVEGTKFQCHSYQKEMGYRSKFIRENPFPKGIRSTEEDVRVNGFTSKYWDKSTTIKIKKRRNKVFKYFFIVFLLLISIIVFCLFKFKTM